MNKFTLVKTRTSSEHLEQPLGSSPTNSKASCSPKNDASRMPEPLSKPPPQASRKERLNPRFRSLQTTIERIPARVTSQLKSVAAQILPRPKEDLYNLKNTVFEKTPSSNGKVYSYVAGNEIDVMQARPNKGVTRNTIAPSVLTSENYITIKQWAALAGMEPHSFLTALSQPGNYCRKSLNPPGFNIYRKILTNKKAESYAFTIAAKIENQEIIAAAAGTELDHLFMFFPKAEETYARLENEGWTIKLLPGMASYCDRSTKTIFIRSFNLYSPAESLVLLAHEMAHAQNQMKNTFLRKEYIDENVRDEGNSSFAEFMLLEQCQNQSQKETILHAIEELNPPLFQERYLIYQKWQHDKDDQAAIKSFGDLYSHDRPSGCPTGVTYKQHWETWYDIWWPDGSQNPKNLIAELQQKNPVPYLWNGTKNCSEPVSENNVSIITRLPKQENEEEGKIIFIDPNMLQQQIETEEADPSRSSFNLVKTGLSYGNITIQPGDTSTSKIANLRFNQHNIDYHIQLTFNDKGQVSNFEINESESITFFLNT